MKWNLQTSVGIYHIPSITALINPTLANDFKNKMEGKDTIQKSNEHNYGVVDIRYRISNPHTYSPAEGTHVQARVNFAKEKRGEGGQVPIRQTVEPKAIRGSRGQGAC